MKRGLELAPSVGINGAFYPRMYITTREEWERALEEAKRSGDDALYGIGHDNYADIGATPILHKGGYSYLYYVDAYGDYCSVAFAKDEVVDGEST